MKFAYLLLSAIVFVLASCSSDADQFSGAWQSVMDPSKQVILARTGDQYTFESKNIESSIEGAIGTYNKKEERLEFSNDEGGIIFFEFDAADHLLGLGNTFEKAIPAVEEKTEENPAVENADETTPSEKTDTSATTTGSCEKGAMLVISGNNVRVRNEPDLTKQNILFQVHKNYEVVHLDDKTVDGQKWYKVCYDGNIGWVSGQYAAKK